jgi:hypothetical protein
MSTAQRVQLVCWQVAFGSAPGVPNWGRLLQRASDGMADDDERFFDTLFAVDPARGWYRGAGRWPGVQLRRRHL